MTTPDEVLYCDVCDSNALAIMTDAALEDDAPGSSALSDDPYSEEVPAWRRARLKAIVARLADGPPSCVCSAERRAEDAERWARHGKRRHEKQEPGGVDGSRRMVPAAEFHEAGSASLAWHGRYLLAMHKGELVTHKGRVVSRKEGLVIR